MRIVHHSAIAIAAGMFTIGLAATDVTTARAEMLLAQVTSTNQIEDVDPNASYYPALERLIEQHGINMTYADGTFQGEDVLTYGEFALGLNQALDSLNRAGWTPPPQPAALRAASVVDVERTNAYFEAVELLSARYNVNLTAADGTFDGDRPIAADEIASYINQATGLTFDGGTETITRGDFAVLLDQMMTQALTGL
jgi:hypothetical protein